MRLEYPFKLLFNDVTLISHIVLKTNVWASFEYKNKDNTFSRGRHLSDRLIRGTFSNQPLSPGKAVASHAFPL